MILQETLGGQMGVPIPVAKPRWPSLQRVSEYVESIPTSGQFTNYGPLVERLERRIENSLGLDPGTAVCVSNGTIGLAAAIRAIAPDRRWQVPSWTFVGSAAAAVLAGVQFHFVDVDPKTQIPYQALEERTVNPAMLVAPFGANPKSLGPRIAPLTLVDAAASLGNIMLSGMPEMDASSAAVVSLHATKPLGSGEGGIVFCGSSDLASKVRAWINFGFQGARDAIVQGINGKMSELAAAVSHAALDGFDIEHADWTAAREMATKVSQRLEISRLDPEAEEMSPYWILCFKEPSQRDAARDALSLAGIETRLWWSLGCHRMRAYKTRDSFPATDWLASRYLGLPMYRGMSKQVFGRVESVIADSLDRDQNPRP